MEKSQSEKGEISLVNVLHEISNPIQAGEIQEFALGFIRLTKGPKQGTFKEVKRARKGGKDSRKQASSEGGGRKSPNLKKSKLLLLFDLGRQQNFYVSISSIIQYNGWRVRH